MKLEVLCEDARLGRMWKFLRPWIFQDKRQWVQEVNRLVSDNMKRIQITALDSRFEGLDENKLGEIKALFEDAGFICNFQQQRWNVELVLAMDESDWRAWEGLNLTAQDWGNGQPFLSAWMLGFSTSQIISYYDGSGGPGASIPNAKDTEEIKTALDHDRIVARKLGLPYTW